MVRSRGRATVPGFVFAAHSSGVSFLDQWLCEEQVKWILFRPRSRFILLSETQERDSDEKPISISSLCLSVAVLADSVCFERVTECKRRFIHGNAKSGQGQSRVRVCVPEDEILRLHDRSQNGRPLRLRYRRRAANEGGRLRQQVGEREPRRAGQKVSDNTSNVETLSRTSRLRTGGDCLWCDHRGLARLQWRKTVRAGAVELGTLYLSSKRILCYTPQCVKIYTWQRIWPLTTN